MTFSAPTGVAVGDVTLDDLDSLVGPSRSLDRDRVEQDDPVNLFPIARRTDQRPRSRSLFAR